MIRHRRRLWLETFEARTVPAVVTSAADSGAGSLRDTILLTNTGGASAADNAITFDPSITSITLNSALPAIDDNLTLTGPGSGKLTIQRNTAAGSFRVLALSATGATRTVAIAGVTLTKGSLVGASQFDNGGGLLIGSHNVTLTDVVVTGNTSNQQGGGIAANNGGVLTLINSTVSGNTASGGFGGGIYFPYDGALTVNGSTISGNVAASRGGGVYLYAASTGTWAFVNSTVSGNKVTSGTGTGGGISLSNNATGTNSLTVRNTTITLNSAASKGGGIFSDNAKSPMTLESDIISGNLSGSGAEVSSPSGNTVTAKNTAFGSKSGILTFSDKGGNLYGQVMDLGALQNNGGPTFTHSLGVNSKAIDVGFNAAGAATDQRGLSRTYNVVDMGSLEVQPVGIPTAAATAANVTTAGTMYTFTVTYTDETAILGSTIGAGDVTVSGPSGFSTTPTFVSVDQAGNGAVRIATYSFTAPGGTWDAADDGTYTVSVVASQVSDTSGNFVPAGAVGTFLALLPRTLVVTNANDSGVGSLRDALADANGFASADVIAFDPTFFATPRTITLTSQLTISDSVTVVGPGSSKLSIDGAFLYRHLVIDGPGALTVTVSGMTLENGRTAGNSVNDRGGSVQINDEVVTLDGVVVRNNATNVRGGAIALQGAGSLTFKNGTISGNSSGASFGGGGIVSDAPGHTIIVRDSTISGNTGGLAGGGIYSVGGSLTLDRTSIIANQASDGGGLHVGGPSGSSTLTILSCTIANNKSTNQGAGLQFQGATPGIVIRNSTISGNSAGGTAGGGLLFGVLAGPVLIQNSTIVNNTAAAASGIAITTGAGASVTLDSTILAANIGDPAQPDFQGTIIAHDSFFGVVDTLGAALDPTSTNNVYGDSTTPALPDLGPLANNGGATLTHAPNPTSPVIDAGSNPAGLATDQRGLTRVVGGVADVGAFEVQAAIAKIATVVINGGAAQRSRVTSIAVTFDSPVTLPANPAAAFQLKRQSDSQIVSFSVTLSGTTATLTFTGGPVNGTSLADGRYTLTVLAAQVGGAALDGNGDGTGGDDFVLVGTPANKLFRIYGDADGDGDVDVTDFVAFRAAFGSGASAIFDSDGDGDVDVADFVAFRGLFGQSI